MHQKDKPTLPESGTWKHIIHLIPQHHLFSKARMGEHRCITMNMKTLPDYMTTCTTNTGYSVFSHIFRAGTSGCTWTSSTCQHIKTSWSSRPTGTSRTSRTTANTGSGYSEKECRHTITHACTHAHTRAHTHTRTCTRTRTHTHTHTGHCFTFLTYTASLCRKQNTTEVTINSSGYYLLYILNHRHPRYAVEK